MAFLEKALTVCQIYRGKYPPFCNKYLYIDVVMNLYSFKLQCETCYIATTGQWWQVVKAGKPQWDTKQNRGPNKRVVGVRLHRGWLPDTRSSVSSVSHWGLFIEPSVTTTTPERALREWRASSLHPLTGNQQTVD